MVTCRRCAEENPDHARFCLGCGSPMAQAAAPSEERRLITAVFTDIVGSTARGERLDPEDIRAYLAPYYARLRAELERHGGTVEKFIGDAVVAIFGAPTAHEDDAERAVRAALAVQDAVAKLNDEDEWLGLHIRTGVNTGEALVVLGPRNQRTGLAFGDVLNTAARIQSAAPTDGILVGEETWRLSRRAIEYRAADAIAAKGKSEPVRVWQPVSSTAVGADEQTPLIGRDVELETIEARWRDVRAHEHGAVVTIVAPPGVGKTRLLAEATARLPAPVFRGRCLAYGEGITYWPIVEILRDVAGIRIDDPQATVAARLDVLLVERLLTRDQDELRTIAAAASNLLGVATTPRGTYSAAEITRGELHWGVAKLVELLAAETGLVLVLEDLHWADPALIELVELIAEADAPLLVLASGRPELVAAAPSLVARGLIELDPLDEQETAKLLTGLLAEAALSADQLAPLIRHAGGNPLFLRETVRLLADRGALDAGSLPDDLPVATSLQSLIGSRLDRLDEADRTVAARASVVGSVFWTGAVAHLSDRADGVENRIESLARHAFVHECAPSSVGGEREFAFDHVLTRDVAYGRVPKGQRASLHSRCAEWIEGLGGAQDEFVEIVAYHLEQSCRFAREVRTRHEPPVAAAVASLRAAGEKAERREGTAEADRFYARALELADAGSTDGLDLRLRRARMLVALGELGRAADALTEIAAEAADAGARQLECASLVALANIDWKQGRAGTARSRLEAAAALAKRLDERTLEVRAAYELAVLRAWVTGDLEGAVTTLRDAIAVAEELDDRALRIDGHMRLGSLLFNERLPEARAELEHAIQLAGDLGSHRDEARATALLAAVVCYLGPAERAEELASQAVLWLERIRDSELQVQTVCYLARLTLARNDPAVAEQRLREALPLAIDSGGWLLLEVYRLLAVALVQQGRTDEASTIVALAEVSVPEEDPPARAAVLVARGILAAATGCGEDAVAAFEEAVEIFEENRQSADVCETAALYAAALFTLGDRAAAIAAAARARATCERIGAAGLAVAFGLEPAAEPGVSPAPPLP